MQLLQHFKELTIRPKNAEELKGLILQLAIQGKLTANWRAENPNVEPALELLNKIKNEKELEKEKGRFNRGKLIDVIDPIKNYGSLPKSWKWVHIDDVLFFITDYQANGSFATLKKNVQYYDTQNYAVLVRLKDLRHNLTKSENFKYTDEKGYKFLKKSSIYGGELLIANVGAGVGTIIEVPKISFKATLAPNMFSIYPATSGVDKMYFKNYCDSPIYWTELRRHIKGTGQPKINKSEYRSCRFPLPPLEEQKEIVKVVETLFKEVEQLEKLTVKRISLKEDFVTSALSKLVTNNTQKEWTFLQEHFKSFFNETTNIKKLRETVLQLAVQGKLTADWRQQRLLSGAEVEDATVLLKRIQEEKAQLIADNLPAGKAGKIKKEKALPSITKEDIPYELPEGWVWCKLGDLVRFMAYGTSQKTNENNNDVPVLRMGNITSEGVLHFNNLKYIPATHKDLPKLYLDYGDLVFNRTNSYELVGKSGVYKRENNSFTLASYLIKVSLFINYINSDYINNYIISQVCRKTQIEPQITAQTNQANFSGSKLKEILVPLPPLEEQKAIVQKVNALMGLCDRLEQEVEQSQEYSEQLMQSCLREVFEGKKEVCA